MGGTIREVCTEEAAGAVAFRKGRAMPGTPFLSEHFERAATEMAKTLPDCRD
mgnify:FL=1